MPRRSGISSGSKWPLLACGAKKLLETMKLIDKSLTAYLGKKPRIAVCGLNPHAGDGGLFGNEERRIIAPAIKTEGKIFQQSQGVGMGK